MSSLRDRAASADQYVSAARGRSRNCEALTKLELAVNACKMASPSVTPARTDAWEMLVGMKVAVRSPEVEVDEVDAARLSACTEHKIRWLDIAVEDAPVLVQTMMGCERSEYTMCLLRSKTHI